MVNILVNIPLEMLEELLVLKGNVQAFKRYVNTKKYSVDKEEVAAFLGNIEGNTPHNKECEE